MIIKAKSKSRPGSNRLKLSAPDNLKFKEGLLIPEALNETEAYCPLDFTSISSREVGQQHSHWAVRYSYLVYLVGNLRAEIGNLRYDIKNAEARWIIANSDKYRTKWRMDAALLRSKTLRELRAKLKELEDVMTRYEGLLEAYKGFRDAASREISRRTEERASRD